MLKLLARFWMYLAFPLLGAALALGLVAMSAESFRATAKLESNPLSGGLSPRYMPSRANTSLDLDPDGVRITARGPTAAAAEDAAQAMADLLIADVNLNLETHSVRSQTDPKYIEDRLALERLNENIATLQPYAAALKKRANDALQAADPTSLAINATALTDIMDRLDTTQRRAQELERRLQDPIPEQPVTITITTFRLSFGNALVSGLLFGLFAAFTVSALLAFQRKTPAW